MRIRTIKGKLIFVVLLISIITLICSSIVSYSVSYNLVTKKAEEIRELAENSTKAVDKINNVISKVIGSVNNLSIQSSGLLEFINKTIRKDYHTMIEVAERYKKDADNYNNIAGDLGATAEEVNAAILGIVETMKEISSLNTSVAADSEKILKATNKASEDSTDVLEQIKEVAHSSEKLKNVIAKFKI